MSAGWPPDVSASHEPPRSPSKTPRNTVHSSGDELASRERVIASIRLLFAVVLLVAAAVAGADHPGKPLSLGVLGAYTVYSLGLLLAIRVGGAFGSRSILAIHLVDLAA